MNGYPMNGSGRKDDQKDGFRGTMIGPFFPGQRNMIASQLNQAFGGGQHHWNQDLSAIYAPFQSAVRFPYAEFGPQPKGGKGSGKGGKDNPKTRRDPDTELEHGWYGVR